VPTDIMRWQTRVDPGRRAASRFTGQIGVFVHLFYGELAEEIAASLLAIPFNFKVYVSTNDSAKKAHIEEVFHQFGLDPVVKILPNRGWDVAPFVLGFIEEMRSHEICLKLHGKRSRHSSDRFGARWREHLLSGLLGDRRNVSRIVDSFVANPELGILMMPHWRGVGQHAKVIGPSYQALQALLNRANMSISSNQRIEFPSGSMFWFRAKALGPLLDLGLTWFDFRGCRPRSVDATIAHGIERSMLIFAAKAGFKWAFVPRSWTLRSWMAAAPRNWVRGKRSPSRAKALQR
jgi:lipopolysaccharide biosynthesis protein